jgi:hypothetical protein
MKRLIILAALLLISCEEKPNSTKPLDSSLEVRLFNEELGSCTELTVVRDKAKSTTCYITHSTCSYSTLAISCVADEVGAQK